MLQGTSKLGSYKITIISNINVFVFPKKVLSVGVNGKFTKFTCQPMGTRGCCFHSNRKWDFHCNRRYQPDNMGWLFF